MAASFRMIDAACVLHRGEETYSTSVTLEVPVGVSFFEAKRFVREQATRQLRMGIYSDSPEANEVIILNYEDVTFENQ